MAASAVSAAVVLAAPIMGQIRGVLRSAFPTHFVAIVGGMVAAAVIAAMGAAILRIRTHRGARYAALAAALTIGVAYSLASRSGVADVDAVEHFHFVEYGVITILFYHAWRARGDASAFVLPLLAGLIVGSLDEWLQWFVPVRVGEMRDVLLNLIAICCGLLVGVAVEPPETFSRPLRVRSVSAICIASAAALLVFAAFVSSAHLGHLVELKAIAQKGVRPLFEKGAVPLFFRSHYTGEELDTLAGDRAVRWRSHPPKVLHRYSREDQYMDEGLWHIRQRNTDWSAQKYLAAWNENLILERYYAPVLDTSSYALPDSARWPAEQRADAAARASSASAADVAGPFVSEAQPYPILLWPKMWFWSVAGAAALALLASAWRASASVSATASR